MELLYSNSERNNKYISSFIKETIDEGILYKYVKISNTSLNIYKHEFYFNDYLNFYKFITHSKNILTENEKININNIWNYYSIQNRIIISKNNHMFQYVVLTTSCISSNCSSIDDDQIYYITSEYSRYSTFNTGNISIIYYTTDTNNRINILIKTSTLCRACLKKKFSCIKYDLIRSSLYYNDIKNIKNITLIDKKYKTSPIYEPNLLKEIFWFIDPLY